MRKLLSYLWLPIFAGVVLFIIYGALTITDLKIKNQKLEEKQNKLETRIAQLENNLGTSQVAASKEEKPSARRRILAVESESTPTPTLATTPIKKTAASTPVPTATPTTIPTPLPSPPPTPTPTPVAQATVTIEDLGSFPVTLQAEDTAFSILLRAGGENGFSVKYDMYDFGAFVTCIGGICGHHNYYWAFYYNGSYSDRGASLQPVSDGDETAWKFESF